MISINKVTGKRVNAFAEFTDADGTTYGPFTKMSSTYDVVNFKTINFNVGEEPPFDDVSSTVIFQ